MRFKTILIFVTIVFLGTLSCHKFNPKERLPEPPTEPEKYGVQYNGEKYYFKNIEDRNRFCDSLGIKIDTIRQIY